MFKAGMESHISGVCAYVRVYVWSCVQEFLAGPDLVPALGDT